MNRQEQLEFCRKCKNRKLDFKQGLICNLTQEIADFEEECKEFELDDTVQEREATEDLPPADTEGSIEVTAETIEKLRVHQDFYYAIVGGLLAMLISALIWAVITVSTEFQIGFMAVGVGLLVGFSIRFFGAGIDKKFGYLGAVLSLLGCMLGNLFSQVGFIAEEQSLGYFETLTYLDPGLIFSILAESFHPMDLLFYGIAIYEGYKLAFRRLDIQLLAKMEKTDIDGIPSHNRLRMPLIIGSIVILFLFSFKIKQGVSGLKTFHYDSGQKMSEGELINSNEQGKWTYWYENGIIQCIGFYSEGIPDSLWQWFDEAGQLTGTGEYKKGLEHGIWMNYYSNGIVSDSGGYLNDRMEGLWKYWYEEGTLHQTGYHKRGLQDSIWITYHKNGQLAEEIIFDDSGDSGMENAWDINGKQMVRNGNGRYVSLSESGEVKSSGEVAEGKSSGIWNFYYENGSLKEEGMYQDTIYLILNTWDRNGSPKVADGTGTYITYYPDSDQILEYGEVLDGYREGWWDYFYEDSGNQFQKIHFTRGVQSGLLERYFESGQLYYTGEMVNDLQEGDWTWYHENGTISSKVTFTDGKKEGKQTIWSISGEKLKEEYYESGKLIKEEVL